MGECVCVWREGGGGGGAPDIHIHPEDSHIPLAAQIFCPYLTLHCDMPHHLRKHLEYLLFVMEVFTTHPQGLKNIILQNTHP